MATLFSLFKTVLPRNQFQLERTNRRMKTQTFLINNFKFSQSKTHSFYEYPHEIIALLACQYHCILNFNYLIDSFKSMENPSWCQEYLTKIQLDTK